MAHVTQFIHGGHIPEHHSRTGDTVNGHWARRRGQNSEVSQGNCMSNSLGSSGSWCSLWIRKETRGACAPHSHRVRTTNTTTVAITLQLLTCMKVATIIFHLPPNSMKTTALTSLLRYRHHCVVTYEEHHGGQHTLSQLLYGCCNEHSCQHKAEVTKLIAKHSSNNKKNEPPLFTTVFVVYSHYYMFRPT
jgi:hypothetical protein